jgi:ketosteroid isomerase-like protein
MTDEAYAKQVNQLVADHMEAARQGDYEKLKTFYTPDATFWINVTGSTKNVDEQFASVAGMRGRAANIEYVDVRVTPFEGGFVQQHRAVGDLPNGGSLNVHAVFICRMRDGKICKREEYLDSAAIAAVRG